MTRALSTRAQQKKADAVSKRHAIQDAQDFKTVLDTAAGRNVLWKILSDCGIFHQIPTNEDKLLDTGARIGKQNFGKDLLRDILLVSPGSYILMEDEDRRRAEEIAQTAKEDDDVGAE